jgi:hypothetical protein
VHYDKHSKRIVVRLNTGLDIAFDPHDVQGLEDGSPDQLDEIEISPSGLGVHFPKLDALGSVENWSHCEEPQATRQSRAAGVSGGPRLLRCARNDSVCHVVGWHRAEA